MVILLRVLSIFFLIFLNGFFVIAEYALVSVRKTRIEELVHKKNISAALVNRALRNLNQYISTTQLGVTIVSIALGWVGQPTIEAVLVTTFSSLPQHILAFYSLPISITIAFVIVAFMDIIFGELAPKTIALQQPEKIALLIIRPLVIFAMLFKPITWLLNTITALLLKMFRLQNATIREQIYSEEEIKLILLESAKRGIINEKEVEMVERVFRLGHRPIHSIMTPFRDIVSFSITTHFQTLTENMKHEIHMRFPIYSEKEENLVGFIHMKDVFPSMKKYKQETRLFETNLVRPILHVPENRRIDSVMFEMQRKQTHIVAVVDKEGKTVGLVTLEDMVESIMGEMQDEFKNPLYKIKERNDGSYIIGGLVYMRQLQDKFHIFLRESQFETLEGVLFGRFKGRVKKKDFLEVGSYRLTIETIKAKRIINVSMQKIK